MFPCSQQNVPLLPVFLYSNSSILVFPAPENKFVFVPSFIFRLFPCFQKVHGHVPFFPETPGSAFSNFHLSVLLMQITTAVSKNNPLCVNCGKLCSVLFNPDVGLPLTKKPTLSYLLIVSVIWVFVSDHFCDSLVLLVEHLWGTVQTCRVVWQTNSHWYIWFWRFCIWSY